mgnify:CR=1 FL=1
MTLHVVPYISIGVHAIFSLVGCEPFAQKFSQVAHILTNNRNEMRVI